MLEVDWLVVDSGSSIHVCKDRSKMINLRPSNIKVKGIVGEVHTVCTEVGDWPMALRNKKGDMVNYTLKNVVHMPNASRDILSVHQLKKTGWWPSFEHNHLYHKRDRAGITRASLCNVFIGDGPCHATCVQSEQRRQSGALVRHHGALGKDIQRRRSRRCSKASPTASVAALATERPITYSLWYGGCGAFAHAMNDSNCASYFRSGLAKQTGILEPKSRSTCGK